MCSDKEDGGSSVTHKVEQADMASVLSFPTQLKNSIRNSISQECQAYLASPLNQKDIHHLLDRLNLVNKNESLADFIVSQQLLASIESPKEEREKQFNLQSQQSKNSVVTGPTNVHLLPDRFFKTRMLRGSQRQHPLDN